MTNHDESRMGEGLGAPPFVKPPENRLDSGKPAYINRLVTPVRR
jgi:hypothetical protein